MADNPDSTGMRGDLPHISRFLTKVYDDDEIVVAIAPDDSSLEELILGILRERSNGISLKELKSAFSGVTSEDKIKKTLKKLASSNKVYIDKDGKIYPTEL